VPAQQRLVRQYYTAFRSLPLQFVFRKTLPLQNNKTEFRRFGS
jgi:hypothetical protein